MLERKLNVERARSHDRMESSDLLQSHLAFGTSSNVNVSYLEHENKDLKQKCNQLEAQLAEKEAELARLRLRDFSRCVFVIFRMGVAKTPTNINLVNAFLECLSSAVKIWNASELVSYERSIC